METKEIMVKGIGDSNSAIGKQKEDKKSRKKWEIKKQERKQLGLM